MFNLIKGAKISNNILLKEEYEINGNWIYANISAENIRKVIDKFVEIEKGNKFCLFIETPANIADENVIGMYNEGFYQLDGKHMDVYYLDNIMDEYVIYLLDKFGDILINDGLSHFGVLSQSGREIGKYKYNVIKAYTRDDLLPLIKVFNSFDVLETDNLVTAWDYFSQDNPGESELYKKDGKTIYDVVDELKEIGLYKYEQREE
ncbi:MAG: hypothetical protein K2I14_03365 [Eubacterium sp.]|nr:hypothetical protein [Eubacterium sp.]